MASAVRGFWLMTWCGLVGNVLALPLIGWFAFTSTALRAANISMAFSLAWPAAIVGIVASAGLLARRRWGVIVTIVALSMALAASLPYGIVRLVLDPSQRPLVGLVTPLIWSVNTAALVFWCRPAVRRYLR